MNATSYAQALEIALRKKSEDVQAQLVKNFLVILRSRGHQKLLPNIVHELEKRLTREQESVKILFAREEDKIRYKENIQADLLEIAKEKEEQSQEIDEKLVGGYRVETKNILIDRSYKRALIDLYQKLLAH
jgi:F0F1-type ATP synthase delta subunit